MNNQPEAFTVPDPKGEAFYGEDEKSVVEDLLSTPTNAEAVVPETDTASSPVESVPEAPKKRGRKPKVVEPTTTLEPVSTEPAPAKRRGRKPGTLMPKKDKVTKVLKPSAKRGRPASAKKEPKLKVAKKVKAVKVSAPKTKGLLRSIKGGLKLVSSGISKVEKALVKLSKI